MENVANKLFNILATKFNNTPIKTLTSQGKETTDMEEVNMFSFEFLVDSKDYGPVVILISEDENLEVYYGDNTSRSLDRHAKRKWENLIEHLSVFARSHRHGFSLKHTTDLKYDLSSIGNITESFKTIFEGYYGTKKTSYNKQGNAKIIIKHSKAIGEEDKRFRNISSLFIENADGERFKLPFKKLTGARAMARHVTEGGTPYDLFGMHITEMVKDINTLGGFVRRSKMFENDEETVGLVETGRNHYSSLRKGLKQISGKRGYHTFKESWEPSTITEQDIDTDTIRSKFTERSINQRVEEALPLLAHLQHLAEKNQLPAEPIVEEEPVDELDEMKEITEFEEWADSVVEGENLPGNYDEYDPVLMDIYEYMLGADPRSVTEVRRAMRDILNDNLEHKKAPGFRQLRLVLRNNKAATLMHELETMTSTIDFGELDETNKDIQVKEGTWAQPETSEHIEELKQFLSTEQPVGIDAMNVTDTLYNLIGDDDLFDSLNELAQYDPDADARPVVMNWIKKNMPEIKDKLRMQQEGCNTELDADDTEHLTASVNKDMDTYINKDKTNENGDLEKMTKLFTEYVAEAEAEKEDEKPWASSEKDGTPLKKDAKKDQPWASTEKDGSPLKKEVDEAEEVVDEDTIELEEAHNGPIVTMESNDLDQLMQRTNHLLKRK